MKWSHGLAARLSAAGVLLGMLVLYPCAFASAMVLPGFASGDVVFVDDDGDRENLFERTSFQCGVGQADAAPDKESWITVNSDSLDATNAKAALVFGHAFAV